MRRKLPTSEQQDYDGSVVRQSSGTCSICQVTFATAQDLYQHLDDCVLREMAQTGHSDAVHEEPFAFVADYQAVPTNMNRRGLNLFDWQLAPRSDEQTVYASGQTKTTSRQDQLTAADAAHGDISQAHVELADDQARVDVRSAGGRIAEPGNRPDVRRS